MLPTALPGISMESHGFAWVIVWQKVSRRLSMHRPATKPGSVGKLAPCTELIWADNIGMGNRKGTAGGGKGGGDGGGGKGGLGDDGGLGGSLGCHSGVYGGCSGGGDGGVGESGGGEGGGLSMTASSGCRRRGGAGAGEGGEDGGGDGRQCKKGPHVSAQCGGALAQASSGAVRQYA